MVVTYTYSPVGVVTSAFGEGASRSDDGYGNITTAGAFTFNEQTKEMTLVYQSITRVI